MVRLHTFLLAVTLATASPLASSNEYPSQRRSDELDNQVHSSKFEQRVVPNPSRRLIKFRCDLACTDRRNNLQSRAFVDKEDIFVRDLDASDNLEAREPSGLSEVGSAVGSVFIINLQKTPNGMQISSYSQVLKKKKIAKKIAGDQITGNVLTSADLGLGSQAYNAVHVHPRGLENNIRASDDLEVREPSKSAYVSGVLSGSGWLSSTVLPSPKFEDLAASGHQINTGTAGVLESQLAVAHVHPRGLEDNEHLFEALNSPVLPTSRTVASAFKFGRELAKHKHAKHILNGINYEQQIDDALQ